MIIVSQDKKQIINFDNIIRFFIGFTDDNKKRSIRYEAVNKTYEELGIYETEERAKEVLSEIINCYEMTEFYKVAAGADQEYIQDNSSIFKYEMPEE